MQSHIAILFTITIILFIYFLWTWYRYETMKWINPHSIQNYYLLRKKYGKPCYSDFSSGGSATWSSKKLKSIGSSYHEIIVKDENVPHCVPTPHNDHLYHYIQYGIPKERVFEVIKLSGSLSYDPLKKLICSRSDSEEGNVATLWLAVKIAKGEQSFETDQARAEAYIIAINNAKNNITKYLSMYDELTADIKSQPNPNLDGYFPLAFPSGCCAGYDPVLNKCAVHTTIGEDSNTLVQNFEGMPRRNNILNRSDDMEIRVLPMTEVEDGVRNVPDDIHVVNNDKCSQRLSTMQSLHFNEEIDNVDFNEGFNTGCVPINYPKHKPSQYKHVNTLTHDNYDKEMMDKSVLTNLKSDNQSLSGGEIEAGNSQSEPYTVRNHKYF